MFMLCLSIISPGAGLCFFIENTAAFDLQRKSSYAHRNPWELYHGPQREAGFGSFRNMLQNPLKPMQDSDFASYVLAQTYPLALHTAERLTSHKQLTQQAIKCQQMREIFTV